MRKLLIMIAAFLGLTGPARADWCSKFNAGNAAYDNGDLDTGIADYTKAIELKPDLAGAYNRRGLAYFAKGLRDQAIADYPKTIELKPDYANAYYHPGLEYEKLGQREKAIADYRQAISLDPGMKEAQDGLQRLGVH